MTSTTTLNKLEIDHDRNMKVFGTIGTLAGAAIGTALVPHIPRSEMMYTVILPFTTTYIGLALGFFSAGFVRKFGNPVKTATHTLDERDTAKVHAVFTNFDDANGALIALTAGGIKAAQIEVLGEDSDDLRWATTPLHVKRLDKKILLFGALGLVVGSVWGYIGCPHLATTLPSVIMSALMAGFCGALLGMLAGAQIAGMLNIDNMPMTDATMTEAAVDGGVIALSVSINNATEQDFVAAVFGTNRIGYAAPAVEPKLFAVAS